MEQWAGGARKGWVCPACLSVFWGWDARGEGRWKDLDPRSFLWPQEPALDSSFSRSILRLEGRPHSQSTLLLLTPVLTQSLLILTITLPQGRVLLLDRETEAQKVERVKGFAQAYTTSKQWS